MFTIGFEFAGHVLNNYWHLKPYLAKQVQKLYRERFQGFFVIGIHIRTYYTNNNITDSFFDCALKIEAKMRPIIKNQTVKWFIATDSSELLEELTRKYSRGRLITNTGKIGHIVKDPDSYERALLDVEMLSLCNETILTGGSTFGLVASFKSQKIPYVVENYMNPQPECQRFEFSAPARTPKGNALF